ncbi:MAG: hypothetical protein JOS17DRAFT_786922 [Linnemannia elongata]|nr:MAG: hypothetical protein JOS17DRAFT_786922 [Linnemannia elongata]
MIPTIPKDAVDRLRSTYPVRTQGVPVFNTSTPFVFPGSRGPPAPVPAHWGTTPLVLPSNSSNNTLLPPPPTLTFQNQVTTSAAGPLALSQPTTASAQGWQNLSAFGGRPTPLTDAQLDKMKKDILAAGFSQQVLATHFGIASHKSNPPVVFGPPRVSQPLTVTHPTQTFHAGGFGSTQPQHRTGPFHSLPPPVNQPTSIWAPNAGVFSQAPPQGGFGMPLNLVVPAQTNLPVLPPAPKPAPAVLAAPIPLSLWSNQQGFVFHGIVIPNNISKCATSTGASDCLDSDELMRQMRENVAVLEEEYEIMKEVLVGDPEYEKKLKEWKENIDKQWDEIWSRLYQRHAM